MKKFTLYFLLLLILTTEAIMATEEPSFTLESTSTHYEIRQYNATLVAETLINDVFDKAGNKAFNILADYIFGNNLSKTNIDMTAPVSQQAQSEEIAMTAPVSQTKSTNGFLVQFTMPAKFNIENIPTPIDKRVVIREVPGRKVAVFTYSGVWSEERYKEKLAEFKKWLEEDGVKTKGEPIFARFNSPFQLWFLRRNEIWLEVADS